MVGMVSMVGHRNHGMVGKVDDGNHGFVNDRCSVGRSWHNRGSVSRRRRTIGWLLYVVASLRRILGHPLIGHLSYVPVIVVGRVVHVLDPSVRQSNGVGTLPRSCAVVRFCCIKVCFRVVVRHCIVEGVGGYLCEVWVAVGFHMFHNWWCIGRGGRGTVLGQS